MNDDFKPGPFPSWRQLERERTAERFARYQRTRERDRQFHKENYRRGGALYEDLADGDNSGDLLLDGEVVGTVADLEHYGSGHPIPFVHNDGLDARPRRFDSRARIHRCTCGAYFIAHRTVTACLACRRKVEAARLRAYTAERSAKRAEARRNRSGQCERCGKPTPIERSTRRYCSPACRQAAYRERLA
jgi:hypothetical protein